MQTERNTKQTIDIRPFRDEDRATIVAFSNVGRPAHRRRTVESWTMQDLRRSAETVFLRRVAGEPAVAFLSVVDRSTTISKKMGVCAFDLRVAPEWRGHGIEDALYAEALAFARERGAKRMVTNFTVAHEDDPAVAFLTERGFTELERDQPSYLDVATLDLTPFLPAVERAEAQGVRFFTYADAGDTEENRQRLFALTSELDNDVPHRDAQARIPAPYEQWVKYDLGHPQFRAHLMWLAEQDGAWVGACHLAPRLDGAALEQHLTGVLRSHRGQGIATALKAVAYRAAKTMDFPIITTENHEINAPMLAINKKFGFVPEAPEVTYNKDLEDQPHADGTEH